MGISDEHSDVDLINYYDALPDRAAFDACVLAAGVELTGGIGEPGPDGFVSRCNFDGIEVQSGAQLVSAVERRLDRIQAADVDWMIAKVAMGLLEGLPLHGEEAIRGWQARAAYPESLRRREVEANLGFFPVWRIDDHLAARDAVLFRRQMLLDGAFRVVAVLSALNRVYFSTFQFKRARAHFDQLKRKPERLAERLDLVANGPPSAAAQELRTLVEETKALIRSEMPDVTTDVDWQPPRDGR